MYQPPTEGREVFEVTVYNRKVREMVKRNESHWCFDDQWAQEHVQGVTAFNAEEARQEIERRYPPDEGFVIEKIASVE